MSGVLVCIVLVAGVGGFDLFKVVYVNSVGLVFLFYIFGGL